MSQGLSQRVCCMPGASWEPSPACRTCSPSDSARKEKARTRGETGPSTRTEEALRPALAVDVTRPVTKSVLHARRYGSPLLLTGRTRGVEKIVYVFTSLHTFHKLPRLATLSSSLPSCHHVAPCWPFQPPPHGRMFFLMYVGCVCRRGLGPNLVCVSLQLGPISTFASFFQGLLFFPPFMPPCSPVLVISTTPPRPNVFSYVCGLRVSQGGGWPEPRVCLPGSDFNFCQFFQGLFFPLTPDPPPSSPSCWSFRMFFLMYVGCVCRRGSGDSSWWSAWSCRFLLVVNHLVLETIVQC